MKKEVLNILEAVLLQQEKPYGGTKVIHLKGI